MQGMLYPSPLWFHMQKQAARPCSPRLRFTRPAAPLLVARQQTRFPAPSRAVVCRAAASVEGSAPAPAPAPAGPEAVARVKNVKGSPSKVRRLLDVIRGRTYEEALLILLGSPLRPREPITKVLMSPGYARGAAALRLRLPAAGIMRLPDGRASVKGHAGLCLQRLAARNAKHNLNLSKKKLYVHECYCDKAKTFKRFSPRAKGRADQILKRNSHITIKMRER